MPAVWRYFDKATSKRINHVSCSESTARGESTSNLDFESIDFALRMAMPQGLSFFSSSEAPAPIFRSFDDVTGCAESRTEKVWSAPSQPEAYIKS